MNTIADAQEWQPSLVTLSLKVHVADQAVSQEISFAGKLDEANLRRRLHDGLDALIYRSLAAGHHQ